MKKQLLTITFIIEVLSLKAQVTTPQIFTPNATTVSATTNNTGTTAGFIGIGTNAPQAVLDINAGSKLSLRVNGGDMSNRIFYFFGGTGWQGGSAMRKYYYEGSTVVNASETFNSTNGLNTGTYNKSSPAGITFTTFPTTTINTNFTIGTENQSNLLFKTNNTSRFKISGDGIVTIDANTTLNGSLTANNLTLGTPDVTKATFQLGVAGNATVNGLLVIGKPANFTQTTPFPTGYSLYVQDGILTEKVKVAVKTTTDWRDYVFENDYKLKSLEEVETFVKTNKHLPGIPSAKEVVANGLDLATMDAKLLEKIEELTLYMIELKKQNDLLAAELAKLKK